ncbi:hypothetical protein LOCC1_G003230 [Lachnellula occidentalis]|uniref:Uncharacterized protein n=1 Tax=Lachnellula occidentalis TaxID=215460 RepID=A0A8H8UJG7_9HELO|nr:hypothetical protein LOCC1_G003230 [Lachnellula occidentalis]
MTSTSLLGGSSEVDYLLYNLGTFRNPVALAGSSPSSLPTLLGLHSTTTPVPSLAATFLISNFIYAYAILSTRYIKNRYKFDHNSSPREDVAKYGEAMVREGKLSAGQLAMVKRWESAHANAVEGYTFFVAGVLLGLHAGVPTQTLNRLMALYSLARIGFGISYIAIERERKSWLRTLFWWTGNISCITMMVQAGKRL